MMSEKYVKDVVDVRRFGDRLMMVTLMVGVDPLVVICAYAPHVD